jgi:hypothetical protein
MESPDDYGSMDVYVRESCRDDRRYPFRPLHFPYARFNTRKLRMPSSVIGATLTPLSLFKACRAPGCDCRNGCRSSSIDSPCKPLSTRQPEVQCLASPFTPMDPSSVAYILPPLVNSYGRLFSVGALLASGHASLLSNGALMSRSFNIAPYARPSACTDRCFHCIRCIISLTRL